ncbi:hypothetical protein [Microlunatus sp. GCM10028923]|uniref:hypothetical protein n=1 Tax=Microlunatus sp. GCM10028923 TaxID=3273400 RepID=UPI00360E78C3
MALLHSLTESGATVTDIEVDLDFLAPKLVITGRVDCETLPPLCDQRQLNGAPHRPVTTRAETGLHDQRHEPVLRVAP